MIIRIQYSTEQKAESTKHNHLLAFYTKKLSKVTVYTTEKKPDCAPNKTYLNPQN